MRLLLLCVGLIAATGFAAGACAQSRYFRVPTASVNEPGRTEVGTQIVSRFERHRDGGFQEYQPNVDVGVGANMEVGVNLVFDHEQAPDQPIELQPNAKWRFYGDERTGISTAVGGTFYAPVADRAGGDARGQIYVVASKNFGGAQAPHVTGGVFSYLGLDGGRSTASGVMLAYEQPLTRRLSFVADWTSGRDPEGFLTSGVFFDITERSRVKAAYTVGNKLDENNGFFFAFEVAF